MSYKSLCSQDDVMSEIVEGKILGVSLSDNGKSRALSILLATGSYIIIKLRGIDSLLATELREQNIIETVKIFDGASDEKEYQELLAALFGDQYGKQSEEILSEKTAHIKGGRWKILEVRAIYGVELIALVEAVQFNKLRKRSR